MDLLYKPDWEKTKERYIAWWEHEIVDRCAIAVTAPKAGMSEEEEPPLPVKIEDRWLDLDYLSRSRDYWMRHTFYGGEALPVWNAGYPGWDFIPAYLGAKVTLAEYTGWLDPIIESDTALTDYDYKNIIIKSENHWWNFALKIHRFAAEQAKGKSIPGIQAIGGCGDTLACMRSTNKLLLDVIDCPDYVREFELYLMKQWIEVYEEFYKIIHDGAEGSMSWFGLWSPGRTYVPQNDFSYMISPKMFIDIFLPAIEMQINYLDHSIYHVDGIGAFAHIDALCEIQKLQAIQILPGAGKPSPLFYMDELKKVQTAGKNLHISIAADEVEAALENLSVKGLFIQTRCDSEEEARLLLKNVEKWSNEKNKRY